MSRQALTGIGQAIKANTTEKSIEQLRAEGKSKVRVVSSERVMAIIQAIVDDTISSEVGAITQRDRDRIVSDTKERFSHVLKMQQDSEEAISELRTALNTAELERDRLKNDKSLLEAQLEAAHRDDGEAIDLERVSRDVARVKDTVDRIAQSTAKGVDEVALGKLAEKLASQDAQTSRRLSSELDDLRERVGHLVRDISASRDAAIEESLQRARDMMAETEAPVQARIDRDLRSFGEHLADIREKVGHAPAAEEAVTRLRGNLDAVEKRLQGMERSSAELAVRVSETVMARIEEREAKTAAGRNEAVAAQTAALAETLRRMHHAAGEGVQNVLKEIGTLRESADEAQTASMSVRAEQFRDLERRMSAGSAEGAAVITKAAEQFAARTAALDGTLQSLRRDLAALAERVTAQSTTGSASATEAVKGLRGELAAFADRVAAQASTPPAVVTETLGELRSQTKAANARTTALEESLQSLRGDLTAFADRIAEQTAAPHAVVAEALEGLREHASKSAARRDQVHADISTRLEQTTAELRREIVALNARGTETAERHQESVRVLGELIARSTTAQSDSLQSTFREALDRALDKIEKTMQNATARPIEMTGEATEVLLSKIFDDPTNELTSNYDQLDVQQRKSTGSIAKSVGRLKEMGGAKKSKEQPA